MEMKKLDFAETLKDSIAIGVKNAPSVVVAVALWLVTIWIPYINIGTTIAISLLPVELAKGSVINPLGIFDSKYRRYMGEYLITAGLMVIPIYIAFVFMIVPGIVLSLSWALSFYFLLGKGKNPMQAIKASNDATYGSKWTMFLVTLVFGIMVGIVLMSYCYWYSRKKGWRGQEKVRNARTLMHAAWDAKWALMVPVIVLGGIYGGIMTPTEAAAIAAFYGLIVGLFLYKEMDFKCLINSCIESCETSAVIIVLMAMATLFGNIMTIEDVPGTVARAILSFSENKIVILMLINVLLLIVGTFMEALAAIVILVPILLPIVTGVGVSPLHFGVIIVVNLAIGFITPPVGVNLFVASGVAKAKLENIASQALPMIALMLIVLLICTYIPEVPLILVGGPH